MRDKKYNRSSRWKQKWIVLLLGILVGIGSAQAEGSKDLYPVNARGARAVISFGEMNCHNADTYNPVVFASNKAVHYVYAEEGERIALATDVQQAGLKEIALFAPDGSDVQLNFAGSAGNIPNRQAELAGPRLPGQEAGNDRYLPIYYTVPLGGAGIYRVEMTNTRIKNGILGTSNETIATVWPPLEDRSALIAWDISVAKRTAGSWNWINGRVFTTILTFHSLGNNIPKNGFYGTFKIATHDGYVYNLETNGVRGISLPIIANNYGLSALDAPGLPLYKSDVEIRKHKLLVKYGEPYEPDTNYKVSYKIFYNLPDQHMPEKAAYALTRKDTWLNVKEKNASNTPVDFKLKYEDAGGSPGIFVTYDNLVNSTYRITIKPKEGAQHNFVERILKGTSSIGENKVYWDGKDGQGIAVPLEAVTVNLSLRQHFGEIHVPYLFVALNLEGMILELLSKDLQTVRSDKVYWSDKQVYESESYGNNQPMNDLGFPLDAHHNTIPEGISSRTNGHKYPKNYNNSYYPISFRTSFDTWAFADRSSSTVEKEAETADLEVVSVESNQLYVTKNEEVVYGVKVKNNGPHAVTGAPFTFSFPSGLEPVAASFTGQACGSESVAISFDASQSRYTSELNLGPGCEGVYTIKLKAVSVVAGPIGVEATIMRPDGVYDPDATNVLGAPPTDPHYECEHNGLAIPCNNIKENRDVFYSNGGFTLIKDGVFHDSNQDGLAQAGETISYELKLQNTGESALSNIVLLDPLLGGVISVVPEKSLNSDDILDVHEVWTYRLTYAIVQGDILNRGVYNQAEVRGTEVGTNIVLSTTSKPTILLTPTDSGYDPNRKEHTFVPLKGTTTLISNPMVRQRLKK